MALIGFAVTIRGVWRAKGAAQQAREAVANLRGTLVHMDAMADLSAVMVMMQEIKRLHRAEAWPVVLDRYADLRMRLIAIKAANRGLSRDHQAAIQAAIVQFKGIERRVEAGLEKPTEMPSWAVLNETVASQLDGLEAVLTSVRLSIGG